MSNLLTNSRLRARRDCARKHHLLYVEGWRTTAEPEYFRIGRLFHLALEAWWADGLDAALGVLVTCEAKDEYERTLVEESVRAYDERWGSDRDRYELVANEARFEAPLINPETDAASRTFLIAGRVDKIVRDRDTNRLLLVEHKVTTDDFGDDGTPYWSRLAMDTQVSHYVLGAESLGHPVEGCLYDVAKRVTLRPLTATPLEDRRYTEKASKLKDGTLRPAGSLYAGQREHDETPAEFGQRVRAALRSDLSRSFRRREVPRMESQIRDHLYDVWATAGQIREDLRVGRAPRNPDACHRVAGAPCAFWDICANGLDPAEHPEAFVRLEDVHPELEVSEGSEARHAPERQVQA